MEMTWWRCNCHIGELKQRHFWATHVNRKWGLFHFKAPWRSQICISKCLNYYRDDLSKNLHVNRKWSLFHFKAPWRSQICISKCLNYYRDDLSKNLHVNRKWSLFHFKAPWRSQICIAKCRNYYRDDLTKNLGKNTVQKWKKDDFRLTFVAQKRPCLSQNGCTVDSVPVSRTCGFASERSYNRFEAFPYLNHLLDSKQISQHF